MEFNLWGKRGEWNAGGRAICAPGGGACLGTWVTCPVSGIGRTRTGRLHSRENFAYGSRSRNPGRRRPVEFQDSREKVAYGCIQEKILHMETRSRIPVASDRTYYSTVRRICQEVILLKKCAISCENRTNFIIFSVFGAK